MSIYELPMLLGRHGYLPPVCYLLIHQLHFLHLLQHFVPFVKMKLVISVFRGFEAHRPYQDVLEVKRTKFTTQHPERVRDSKTKRS